MAGCFAMVSPDAIGVCEWMGTFQGILEPGFHWVKPWSTVHMLSSRVVEVKCVTETKTKDNVFVKIHISVQQEVLREKAKEACYKLSDPRLQIESFVADVIRSHAPNETLDELFLAKEKMAIDVKERVSVAMASYGYKIHQVLVTDVEPDARVKAAMNEINASKRMLAAAAERAEADKAVKVKTAEAEAQSKFLQGEGIARSRAAIVEGLKQSVSVPGQKNELSAKDVTELLLMTQYLDTLEKLGQGKSCTVFVPHSVGGMAHVAQEIRDGIRKQ